MRKLHEKTVKELVETYSDVIDINKDMDLEEVLIQVLEYENDHFADYHPTNPLLNTISDDDPQYTEESFDMEDPN